MKKILLFLIIIVCSIHLNAQINGQVNIISTDIQIQPKDEFVELNLPHAILMDEVGSPQIPYFTKTYIIPVDAQVTEVRINSQIKQKLIGSFYIYPAQPPIPSRSDYEQPPFSLNDSIYNSINPFPQNIVKILYDGFDQGYHIVTVGIYPIEYAPQTREIYFYNIDFTLEYVTSPQINSSAESFRQSIEKTNMVKSHIKSIVENSDDVDLFSTNILPVIQSKNVVTEYLQIKKDLLNSPTVEETIIPEYIIITNNKLKPTFQKLADWKTKKGIPTIIKTIEDITPNFSGSDTPEKIRNYIIESSEKWGKSLFILLGGDFSIIPSKMMLSYYYAQKSIETYAPIDIYYASNNGNWNILLSDKNIGGNININHYLGRALVENVDEAETFVKKVLSYEKADVEDKSYYNNLLVCDAFMQSDISIPRFSDQAKYALKNKIHYPSNLRTQFIFDDYNCSGNTTRYTYGTNTSGWTYGPCVQGNKELTRKNVLSTLSRGDSELGFYHIIYDMDHGSPGGHGISSKDKGESMLRSDVETLSNGSYQQIFMTGSCNTAQFDLNCFAKGYLNNPKGGCVAYIGNSDNGYTSEIWQFNNFIEALKDSLTPYHIGYVFRAVQGLDESGAVANNRKIVLIGDPEMQIWTATPKILNVLDTISSISVGKVKVSVTIQNLTPTEKATICLMKGSEAYRVNSVTGSGTYNFILDSHTSDSIDITVSAHNYIPIILRRADPSVYNTNLSIDEMIFDDGNIDGDSILGAGETVKVTIRLKNTGDTIAKNVSSTLSCNSKYITMINSASLFGNILPGGEASSTSEYSFRIDKNTPDISKNDLDPIVFNLSILDSINNAYNDTFNIDVFTSKLQQENKTIEGIIVPGANLKLNIDLFNAGRAEATGVTAKLISNSAYISSVNQNISIYPDIKYQKHEQNITAFDVNISNAYTIGKSLYLKLEVENEYGKRDSFNFDLADRPTQVLKNAISFVGKESEIELKWTKPEGTSFTVGGYHLYRSDTEYGEYKRINTYVVPNAYYIDYTPLPLSRYYYKVSAVSTTGNEGPLSEAKETWTSFDDRQPFPVTMNLNFRGKRNSPFTLYDVNNDGMLEIFSTMCLTDNNRAGCIIGLDHEGIDLFDIDKNITTKSGFADMGLAIRGAVGIGDLYGIGENQIISVTRENANSVNYITCHTMKDENKDSKPDILWQREMPSDFRVFNAPILSNIDDSADGSMEIILHTDDTHTIIVLDNNGNELWNYKYDSVDSWDLPSVAVADLDNDGYKEIIFGAESGVYVLDYQGRPYGDKEIFYSKAGHSFKRASAVICDINNDGKKEIVIKSLDLSTNKSLIHVINNVGGSVGNWGTNQITELSNGLSVGDLNGNEHLYVVATGENLVSIWNSEGAFVFSKEIKNIPTENEKHTPALLADIDGDGLVEVLVISKDDKAIYALKLDGTAVIGFPIIVNISDPVALKLNNIAVADIDSDGKTEILAIAGDAVYAWNTKGDANKIEWGSERHDAQNTGEYKKLYKSIIIKSDTIWNTPIDVYGNIIIESGGSLSLNSNCVLNMKGSTMIIVKANAILNINGGKIYNANLKALNKGNVIMKSDGYIKLRNNGLFDIQTGCTFTYQLGNIDR
ncbi:MAG: C25 family cysteine peptidase [Dysgonomonas sp.]